jgi:hypothetical protein
VQGAKGLPLRIEVRVPGHATKVITTEASSASLDVRLAAAESVRGQVRSARGGEPVVDAEVVFYTEDGARHARTDADGTFHFDDLAPGAARLRVRAPGYVDAARDVTIDANGGRRPFDLPRIELAAGGTVEGTVLDARGNPVPGARVANDHVPTYLTLGASPAGVAVADAKGRFKLDGLPEGNLTLEAYAPDVGRAREADVRVVAGRATTDVRITLKSSDDNRTAESAAAGGVAVTLGETSEPREVVVVSVVEGSEAERAGLAPNDALLEVDGVAVHTIAEARARLSGPLSADVLVKVRRADRTETLRVGREQVRR